MSEKNADLTNAEWSVMECIWASSPRTAMQAVSCLKESVGWAKSTTLTMLRRMTAKGLINCDESGVAKLFTPAIKRENAVTLETRNFIKRVYGGSVSMMMNALTEKQELTKEEIEELYAILRRAEAKKE